jgi:LPXTG-motif cell wall-anchored protein
MRVIPRLLAAATIALGFGLAVAPAAGANDIPSASVTCTGWTVNWTHFPQGDNVHLAVTVTAPDGTKIHDGGNTLGQDSGTITGKLALQGTGSVHINVRWTLATDHIAGFDGTVDCPVTPPTTTPPTTTPPPTVPPTVPPTTPPAPAPQPKPPVVTTPPTLPVGTPEGLPNTGADALPLSLVGIGSVGAGMAAIRYRGKK